MLRGLLWILLFPRMTAEMAVSMAAKRRALVQGNYIQIIPTSESVLINYIIYFS